MAMSEKKTLHNVWLIQDKVPIDESADNVPVDDPDDSERKPISISFMKITFQFIL